MRKVTDEDLSVYVSSADEPHDVARIRSWLESQPNEYEQMIMSKTIEKFCIRTSGGDWLFTTEELGKAILFAIEQVEEDMF